MEWRTTSHGQITDGLKWGMEVCLGPHHFPSGTSCPITTGSCLRAKRGPSDFIPEPDALTKVWKLRTSWVQKEFWGVWVGSRKAQVERRA